MAKLYFYYSTMNAGKSTTLLQSSYNYRERGMNTLLFLPRVDDREGVGIIHSRIGLKSEAISIERDGDLFIAVKARLDNGLQNLKCVLIDEAQFLTKEQVRQAADIADGLNIPVLAYGIRTDFQGELFSGSKYLLAWAEELVEIKTICHCGKKATMNARVDETGHVVDEGAQVQIGGNESYISLCHKHFKERNVGPVIAKLGESEVC